VLIGELAKKTGLSKDTIRFYERLGLIEAQARQAGTRAYMEFAPEMLERVVLITQGKSLGFTLNEIRHLIDTWGNAAMPIAEKLKTIDRKLDEINEKMPQLEQIKTYLTAKRHRVMQASEREGEFALARSLGG